MSRLYDLCITKELNKPDIMTKLLDDLNKEIEMDLSIYNSIDIGTLDYWYKI